MEETQNPFQQPIEQQPSPNRYFHFLGNPRYYIWGLVVVLALVTTYTTLAVQKNLWPFHIIQPIVTADYYGVLQKQCETKQSQSCCLSSVQSMKVGVSKLSDKGVCPDGFKKNTLLCIDSFTWCEPIQNEIASWQTYTNSQYWFEIKYPSDWSIERDNTNGSVRIQNYISSINDSSPFDEAG